MRNKVNSNKRVYFLIAFLFFAKIGTNRECCKFIVWNFYFFLSKLCFCKYKSKIELNMKELIKWLTS